jgi:gliding motility-associated-like protein
LLPNTYMMLKYIFYIIIIISSLSSDAQENLILNGGFEEHMRVPLKFLPYRQDGIEISINDILPHWKAPTDGSPDVFLIKNPSILGDAVGYPIDWNKAGGGFPNIEEVNPFKGSGFVGLHGLLANDPIYGENIFCEFIQSRFTNMLNTERKYVVKLHYRISNISKPNYVKLGIHFSTDSLSNYYETSNDNPNFSRFVPPIREYTNVPIGDTTWQEFKYEFRPSQNFEYLTIGCFNIEFYPFTNDTVINSYYFIDDVSLVERPCLVGKDTACENEQITYYSTFAGPFEWWHEGNLVSTDSIFTFKAKKGWYYLKTPYGEDSLYLTVLDQFIDIVDISDTLCPGEVFEVTLPSKFKYRWYDGSTDYSRTFDANTNQKVIIRSEYCTDSININFDYFEWPTAYPVFVYSFCKDSTSSIDVSLPFYSKNFYWSDGQQGFTRSFYQSGNYGYEIIDSNGCSNSGLVTIREQCPSKYFIPNAFAPDGVNKVFRPYLSDVLEAEMIIYNRWGEKIYSEQSSNPSWDGIYQGEPCSVGVYFYILEIIRTDNKKEQLKGNIHLLR